MTRILPENAVVDSGEIIYKGRNLLQIPDKEFAGLRGSEMDRVNGAGKGVEMNMEVFYLKYFFQSAISFFRSPACLAQHLVAEGFADADKVAVMGGSYGGYMTLACTAFYPDLWVAGVDTVGMLTRYWISGENMGRSWPSGPP